MKKRNIIIGVTTILSLSSLTILKTLYDKNKNNKLKNKILDENLKKENLDKIEVTDINDLNKKEKYSYNSFFDSNILDKYIDVVLKFLNREGEDSLKYVRNYIFTKNGDFDYDNLKQLLTERYQNISNIMKADIFSPSMTIFPLERYLSEIDILMESNVEEKVEGILSYWIMISESLSTKDILW